MNMLRSLLRAEEEIEVMRRPAQSPDLNPIKNVRQMLKIKFHERFTHSLSKSQASIDKYGAILQACSSGRNSRCAFVDFYYYCTPQLTRLTRLKHE